VIAGDPKAVLLGVEEMARSGRDPAQFARDLLAHLRFLLVAQTVGEAPNTFVVTATDEDRLAAQAGAIGAATLVRTIDELAGALTAVREGDDARMAVEIALLKAARPDLDPSTEGLLRRIERLEQGGGGGTPRDDASRPRVLSQGEGGLAASPGRTPPPPAPPAEDAPKDESDPPGLSLEEIAKAWPAVLDQLMQTAPALAASFEGARPVGFDADEMAVTVGFPAAHTFNKRKAEAPDKKELLAAALTAVLGQAAKPAYSVLEGDDGNSGGEAPATTEDGVGDDDLVQRFKSEFDAEEVVNDG
jgi:DNA polymerase-3 subunit gamma/tau